MTIAALIFDTACEDEALSAAMAQGARLLFMNAARVPGLERLRGQTTCQTLMRGPFLDLRDAGFDVQPGRGEASFRIVLCPLPKQADEAMGYLARAILALDPSGGTLVAGAANDAGGRRVPDLLRQLGLPYDKITRGHATVCIADCPADYARAPLEEIVRRTGFQTGAEGQFISCPGIFGWDKIDAGSALLALSLPEKLAGVGADFGCGYGFLTCIVLDRYEDVAVFHAADADFRAAEACRMNMEAYDGPVRVQTHWMDLTREALPETLDFIVMNPPFHNGKDARTDLGASMIAAAARGLKPGGVLWMVANTHLPYEPVLGGLFSQVRIVTQEAGFKVFEAVR